jgi:hypothetical protein
LRQLTKVRNHLAALKATHRDSTPILRELVIQRDHYIDYVRQALHRAHAYRQVSSDDFRLFQTYSDTIYAFLDFYSTPSDRMNDKSLTDFSRFEQAVNTWKDLDNGMNSVDHRLRLTQLAVAGSGLAGMSATSRPVIELISAESVISVPSVLNQTLSGFDHRTDSHIIEEFTNSRPSLLGAKRRVETFSDLENLEKEFQDRRADLDAESRLQTFSVPYLGLKMRKGAVFMAGVLGSMLTLIYALRQVIQLRAFVSYSQGGRAMSKRNVRIALSEIAFFSHFVPFLHHNLVVGRFNLALDGRKTIESLLLRLSLGVALLTELVLLCLFISVPFIYLVLQWRLREMSLGFLGVAGSALLQAAILANIFLVLLVTAAIIIVELSIRSPKL